MTVYVDETRWLYGRLKMCHMIADDPKELLAMVDKIGVKRRWIQKQGTAEEHFDIAKGKRALAVSAGAIEIDSRQLVAIIRLRRDGVPASMIDWSTVRGVASVPEEPYEPTGAKRVDS